MNRPDLARQSGLNGNEEASRKRPGTLRTLLGAGVGNMLEWYDWSVYAIFASFFAHQFFVDDGGTGAVLSALAVFAVGFLMRPIGGFVFGALADRRGRKFAMTTSMLLMAAGSLLVGVAPTYAQVGVWAAVILVFARLVQGLAHGGEISAAYTYIAEVAPPHRRGLWSTTVYISITAGILGASLIGAAASSIFGVDELRDWAWRIPFVFGGLLGVVSLYLRRSLEETDSFRQADHKPQTLRELGRGLARSKLSVFRIMGMTAGVTVVYYIWAVGASGFAISAKGADAEAVLWATVFANVFFMLTLPLWGWLADHYGRRRVFIGYAVSMAVLAYPLLSLLNASAIRLGLLMAVALFFIGAFVGPMPAFFSELFPAQVRATGVGVSQSVTIAVLGGTAPYLLTWLSSHDLQWVFGVYTVVLALIGLIATLCTPETKDLGLR